MLLAALLCVVVVVAFAAGDWVGQTTEAIALATPTVSLIGNDISGDNPGPFVATDTTSYYKHGRAGRSTSFSLTRSYP